MKFAHYVEMALNSHLGIQSISRFRTVRIV
jgi:hypothetical protein